MAEGRRYVLEVPGAPLSPNQRRRAHWSVQARDARIFCAQAAMLAREAHAGPPLQRARVVATLLRVRGAPLDPDGAVGRIKHVLDGLTVRGGGNLVVDDDEQHVQLIVQQAIGERRAVRLEITEVLDDDDHATPHDD